MSITDMLYTEPKNWCGGSETDEIAEQRYIDTVANMETVNDLPWMDAISGVRRAEEEVSKSLEKLFKLVMSYQEVANLVSDKLYGHSPLADSSDPLMLVEALESGIPSTFLYSLEMIYQRAITKIHNERDFALAVLKSIHQPSGISDPGFEADIRIANEK